MKALLFDLFLIHSFDKKINRSSFEIMMKKIIKAKLLHSKILVFLYSPPKTIIDEGHVWAMCVFEFDSSMFIFFDEYSSSFFLFIFLFLAINRIELMERKRNICFFPTSIDFYPCLNFFFNICFVNKQTLNKKFCFFIRLLRQTHIYYIVIHCVNLPATK